MSSQMCAVAVSTASCRGVSQAGYSDFFELVAVLSLQLGNVSIAGFCDVLIAGCCCSSIAGCCCVSVTGCCLVPFYLGACVLTKQTC